MSRMGSAQKLSVDQLKQAVQDGTLPAYVGIPLIQDKLKQQQEAQAGKPVPPQPPVADQILQAANQRRGIDEAQSNLPEMTAAEGGIMSYAIGGDVDSEDYEDAMQEAQDQEDLAYAQMMSDASENQGISKEPSYVNKTPPVEFGIKPPTGGVDALLSYIVKKESGGRDYDEKGRPLTSNKGAKFAMQVMDATAKDPGFGIKPAKDVSAEEYNRVGKELATALYGKYQDPKLAAIAYNWGPHNTDKWLASGANPEKLPAETKAYIVGANFADGGIVALAAGGSVPSYASDGLVNLGIPSIGSYDFLTKSGISQLPKMQNVNKALAGYQKAPAGYQGDIADIDASAAVPATPAAPSAQSNNLNTPPVPMTSPTYDELGYAPKDQNASEAPAPLSEFEKYLQGINAQREDISKQKEEDKYLALMAAGLGTLKASGTIEPGKVHTALGDISTGGLEGVAYYANAAKQRAAERAALNKELGLGLYHQEIARVTGGNKAAQLDINRAALEEKKREFAGKQLEGKDKQIRDQVLAGYKIDPTKGLSDPDVAASIEKQIAQAKQNDPTYNLLHKNYYGFDYSTPVKTSTVSFNDLK